MENYLGLFLLVLFALVLLNFLRKGKLIPHKEYVVSDESTREMNEVLGRYKGVAEVYRDRVVDISLLPEPKETIKQYLQISIGLAMMNGKPGDQLLDDYYDLPHFQEIDEGDERFFPLTAKEDSESARSGPVVTAPGHDPDGEAGEIARKYLKRIEDESAALEKELQAFLKRKKLF